MDGCFFEGVFCRRTAGTRYVKILDTFYCEACMEANLARAGKMPQMYKPGLRKLHTPGARWRGTYVSPSAT